jgi:hypothetical protein
MFGRGLTRLQPAYVEDVAEAIGRVMQRAETPSMIFEFGGPRVYSYEEFLRAVAHQAGLTPLLIPIPFAVWHALTWASEMFPSPLLTRNQVELMQIDLPDFIKDKMKSSEEYRGRIKHAENIPTDRRSPTRARILACRRPFDRACVRGDNDRLSEISTSEICTEPPCSARQ